MFFLMTARTSSTSSLLPRKMGLRSCSLVGLKTKTNEMACLFFLVIPGARLSRTPSLSGPLTHLCDLEAGYGGVWAPNLVGRHRDSNPGPPACESGVVAITHVFFYKKVKVIIINQSLCGIVCYSSNFKSLKKGKMDGMRP